MPTDLVLTVLANDRSGLVEKLSDVIAAENGNWVESSMARLAGEFAGIVRVSVEDARVPMLEEALAGLGTEGISVTVRRGAPTPPPEGRHASLSLVCQDHPGIIHSVAAALAEHGVSIDELTSEVFPGSMSGERMFGVQADIVLPPGTDEGDLRAALEDLAGDLMAEIDFKKED
ncbi:ACT domain-containing protein [Stappia sp. GBMRC 2046]|uniref:ACT domain-containing protein n=1 Tax=Stappia sediminis TaxID=2692190 RepID=A0A7X3LX22_9HYPH|nr:ACT domain-containing protein [Stappia sediminis]MXN66640.1 ACT domain-containing protein [Stappia sediminis]